MFKKLFTESKKALGFIIGIVAIIGMMYICKGYLETLTYVLPYLLAIILGYLISQESVDLSSIFKNVTIDKSFSASKKATGFMVGIIALYAVVLLFKSSLEMIRAGMPYILMLSLGYMGAQGILDVFTVIKNPGKFTEPKAEDPNAGEQEPKQ